MAVSVPPGIPQDVAVTVDGADALVAWDPPASDGGADLTRYRLTLGADGDPSFARTPTVPASQTSYQLAGLADGDYTVSVAAENVMGWGDDSAAEPFEIGAPPAPTGYTLSAVELRSEVLGTVALPPGTPPLAHSIARMTRERRAGSGRGALTVELVSAALPIAAHLLEDRVIRLVWDSDTGLVSRRRYEYWRIEAVDAGEAGVDSFSARCRPLEGDLADTVALYERADGGSGGSFDPYVSIYDVDVSAALTMALTRFGTPGRRRPGSVGFIPVEQPDSLTGVSVTVAGEGVTHLDLLNMIAEAAGGRVRYQHRIGQVYVSIVATPDYEGEPAATIAGRHTFHLTRRTDAAELVTALVPLGGPEGAGWTVGGLEWEVIGVVNPSTIAISTPGVGHPNRRGPFWQEGALVGAYLVFEGVAYEITGTGSDLLVTVDGTPFDLSDQGKTVRFAANADGDELVRLALPETDPRRALLRAVNERLRRYEDAAPVPNLLERNATAADFADLTGWTLLGTAGAEPTSDPAYARLSRTAQRVTATAAEDGLETDPLGLDDGGAPYASAWLALRVLSGRWIVELEDGQGNVFGAREQENGWITLDAEAYALAGMEVEPDDVGAVPDVGDPPPSRRVKLRVVCLAVPASGTAEVVLDAATLTQSATEVEYRQGMGPHEVWFRATDELRRIAKAQRAEYAAEVADPRVLASLPPLDVEDLVALVVGGEAVTLPVAEVREELSVGGRALVKGLTLGMPEADASTQIGAALGLKARPGAAAWTEPTGLPTDTPSLARRVRAQRFTREPAGGSGAVASNVLVGRATIETGNASVLVEPPASFDSDSVQVTPDGVPEALWGHAGADGTSFSIALGTVATEDREFTWLVVRAAGVVANLVVIDEGVEEVTFGWDAVPGVDGYQLRRYASEADALAGTGLLGAYTVPVGSLDDPAAPAWTIEVDGGAAFWYAVFSYND